MSITIFTVLGALGIFTLRVADMTLDTIRMLFVFRGRRGLAWIFGFCRSLLFVLAISTVLANMDNPLNVIGYAAGYASGNVVGMAVESRMAIGHMHMTIISPTAGPGIVDALRDEGFAVTEMAGRGKDGIVSVLHADVLRKNVDTVETIVLENDKNAFVTAEEVQPVRRGYWRA